MAKIYKCSKCKEYTMENTCPVCKELTVNPEPARFKVEDKYGAYRRKAKKGD